MVRSKLRTSSRTSLRTMLCGGDRRSIGKANHVAESALSDPKLLAELVEYMWCDEPVIRMRAADAAEKVSAQRAELLQPFAAELLGLADEGVQPELRWHLALILPRLLLTERERQRLFTRLREYLEDRSAIVKTSALQGLTELAGQHPAFQPEVKNILLQALRSGTPAMRARARKLLARTNAL